MDFFEVHGWLFLFGITLLISSVISGGILWWLGWLFAPHLLVAILATTYWDSNPILVIIAWIVAFSGTNEEEKIVRNRFGYNLTRRI